MNEPVMAIALLAIASPALAQGAMALPLLTARFAGADQDHDGRLTRAEARGAMPRVYSHFDAIDTAKRGYVTIDQIKAFARAHM